MPELMASSESEQKQLLKILTSIVLLLGTPAFFSFVQKPSDVYAESFVKSASLARGPASVADFPAAPQHETIQLNCDQAVKPMTTRGTHIRLVGSVCENRASTYHIKNETNGYTASVILTPDLQFTTDFIDLKEGANVISVRDLTSSHVQKIQVTRSPSSR